MIGDLSGKRPRSLRAVAFVSVVISTVSVLSCVITLPLVYNHIQSVQTFMQNEAGFCKTRSMDMWKEMMQLKLVVTIPAANRTKRQYAADKIDIGADEGVGPLAGGSCCSCQVGPPGPPGPPGRDGRPGS
ncbi:unnamed protein product, partial [Enterobius vermicularis]|uniref:Col_cuticle_N domain-containing protein n=1 Tax=Enterobius vermicularis TaxID=51028 RepID=A0A0N4VNC9_ENTVE